MIRKQTKTMDAESARVRAQIKSLQVTGSIKRVVKHAAKIEMSFRGMVHELNEFTIYYGQLAEIISGKKLPKRKKHRKRTSPQ